MYTTTSVSVYPLFGGWRAECKECGAYANCGGNKHLSAIGQAIDNLAKNPTTFRATSAKCRHQYGQHKTIYFIKYSDLKYVKETAFTTQGSEKFPAILLDNKYHITVVNAPELSAETWSAFSYVRFSWLMEQQEKTRNTNQKCTATLCEEHKIGEKAMRIALAHTASTIRQMNVKQNDAPKDKLLPSNYWGNPFAYIRYLTLTTYAEWATILGISSYKFQKRLEAGLL